MEMVIKMKWKSLMLCALPISAMRGMQWCCHGTAFQPEFCCCERRRKNSHIVDRKRQLRFPLESSACAGCGFLRERVQAPSSWPALLGGHISPPACSSPLSHQAPATFSIPRMTLNSFLFTACSHRSLQWANLFCIQTVIRRDHFSS